jgi:hypothetical protein
MGRGLRDVLAALLTGGGFAAMVAATGCGSTPGQGMERPPARMTLPTAELMELEQTKNRITAGVSLWSSLAAKGRIMISNPGMKPASQVTFDDMELVVQRPGRIRLRARRPGTNRWAIDIVGDGGRYEVNLPAFNDRYSGRYGEQLAQLGSRVHLMPDDIVDAFDFSNLFYGKVQTMAQGRAVTTIYSAMPVEYPRRALFLMNAVLYDRANDRVVSLTKYERDATDRVVMALDAREVPTMDGRIARLPLVVRMSYPWNGTAVTLILTQVQLDAELPEDVFELDGRMGLR